MGFFKLGGMTIKSIFKKPETLKYPFEEKEPYEGQKGTIVHADKNACNLCSLCQKRCPCGAIVVDKAKKTWSINHFSCIQCGYCIQGCPKKCLKMDNKKPGISTEINEEVVDIPFVKKTPASKPTPKKPAAKPSKVSADTKSKNTEETKSKPVKSDDK